MPDINPATMKTITMRWTETSEHEVRVSVPIDFTLDSLYDYENDVAELVCDRFIGVMREGFTIGAESAFDPAAQILYPQQ